ncbi:hypothetical protein IM792_06100 [Mucilaginibacter sp. JRF]|uniref:hypothetical protein n=1 Tax=Mucilaginibacter sp. JRF TaxID=2780088 RepID=UPI0018830323|nr:hypothetical protein [Mucilaginibacter sp. JRF]MBE9584015.1 hypothetical protein [Mucilaginibacter sp. JRF]
MQNEDYIQQVDINEQANELISSLQIDQKDKADIISEQETSDMITDLLLYVEIRFPYLNYDCKKDVLQLLKRIQSADDILTKAYLMIKVLLIIKIADFKQIESIEADEFNKAYRMQKVLDKIQASLEPA